MKLKQEVKDGRFVYDLCDWARCTNPATHQVLFYNATEPRGYILSNVYCIDCATLYCDCGTKEYVSEIMEAPGYPRKLSNEN